MKKSSILVVLFFILIACKTEHPFDPTKVDLEWKFGGNELNGPPRFKASLLLKNGSNANLPAGQWKLYFSLRYHGHDLACTSPDFEIVHESGEFFSIRPTSQFKGLKSGESAKIKYEGKRLVANYQDIPSGLFWVDENNSQVAIALDKPDLSSDPTSGKLSTFNSTDIYNKNALIKDIPVEQLPKVFPTPEHYQETPGDFILDGTVVIDSDPSFQNEAAYLSAELETVLGVRLNIGKSVDGGSIIQLQKINIRPEAYQLKVSPGKIVIEAGDGGGIFYGIQSLKTALPPEAWKSVQQSIKIKGMQVKDGPRFTIREFMLDVARNFQPKEEILKVLEIMSLYKLNVFHFHLSDDEGWRLDIPGIPELTEVGAKRGFPFDQNQQLHPSYGSGPTNQHSGTGFYTREDYIEIVKYATVRHIKVVPEIESPGHARAAIKAMEFRHKKYLNEGNSAEANRYLLSDSADQSTYVSSQYFRDNVMNVALPSTYVFIEKVIDEIIAMHNEAGAPLKAIHMAGDEVPFGSWEKSPVVASFLKENPSIKPGKGLWSYYFEEIKKILRKRNLVIYGWQELVVGTQKEDDSKQIIDPSFVSADLQVDAWWNMYGNEDIPYKLANTGYKTVMTCFDHFYFDLAYTESFDEPGDAWIGFLDVDRIFSFIPYDYYRNFKTDVRGKPHAQDFFKEKEKLASKGRQNIVGVQGALWGENLVSSELMEYLLVPRLLALAERAWSADPSWAKEMNEVESEKLFNAAWSQFANSLGKRELPRLSFYHGGIGYRIPVPGVITSDGNVVANIQLPGFEIRYTSDGTMPTKDSKLYSGPVIEKGTIKLRAFDNRQRGSHTTSIVNN